ncbi:hypothetical protein CK203_083726 [Vitis vinifera]|uniref:Uncharacterized protein n=1 Tax=Vitis vinifera TaxID=29760 RepID=A0A438CYD0_VITVI|nr:hypothetical protein CK203_083726 [Vitis vinifera]
MGNYYFCKGDKLTVTSCPVVHNTVRKENKTWTTRRKRKNHVPQKFELVKLSKLCCSGKKFMIVIETLPMEKK